jgi:uncharacterized repeat protein (TIGR01451 family)
MMHELITLLGSVSVMALFVTLVACALGFRRRAIRRGLSLAEVLSQWWDWLRTELSANLQRSRASRAWHAFLVLAWMAVIFLVPYPAQPVSAQGGVGYGEYYIMGDEADILVALNTVSPSGATAPIRSRLSIVSSADDVNIYLDDDGDGYDFDPANPSGTADAEWLGLSEGGVLTLDEGTADGGDRLYITGAPVSVVRTVWAEDPGSYLAGSWELYPIQAWRSSYTVPVGEDLDPPNYPDPFEYTFLFIEAAQDNTRVVVTDPTPTVLIDTVIDQGENIYLPDINAGTTIVATDNATGAPRNVQAGLITSVGQDWDSRYYTLTPEEFLCSEYYLPVPSMQFPAGEPTYAGQDIDTVAYIYAFQDNTVVTIETIAGPQPPITLDAGEVYRYVMPRAPAGTIQGFYGARITADNRIWILVAGDEASDVVDWGYQAMCQSYLDDGYYLPYAPANPAHITPVNDDTTFFVDWDNDDVIDETFTLDRFETRMLFDPDQDAEGAHIYADGLFAMAWGQDNTQYTPGERPNPGDPDRDYGYTVLPLNWYDPVLSIEKTVDPPSLPAEGGAVQFTLVVGTGNYSVYNVDISDLLPVGWEYVNDTTSIDLSYGSDGSGPGYDPSISGDPVSGYALVWDLNGLGLNDTMPANSTIVLTYQARTIPGVYSGGLHDNLAQAYGEDENGAVFRPEDHAFIYIPTEPYLNFVKTSSVVGGAVEPGDEITYTLCFSNSGLLPATGVIITDFIPADTTYMTGSATGPEPPIAPPPPPPVIEYRTDTGDWVPTEPLTVVTALRWNIGQLVADGTTYCVSFMTEVKAGTPSGTVIENEAVLTFEGGRQSSGVDIEVPEEAPGPDPPEPDPPGPDPSDPGQPATTPVQPTPVPAAPTEVLTVERLPETGGFPGWFTVVFRVAILIGAAGLLNLALLETKARRSDREGD